jgi:SAM-dependent methyltransferase
LSIPSNWYQDFFHGIPLDLWRQAIPPEQTKAEADFLENALQCRRGARLLDVPCGNGRLSFELTSRGYCVTGVDISAEFIQEANSRLHPSAHAGGTDQVIRESSMPNPSVTLLPEFVLGDMRRIEGQAIYDGAFCFGNSFGFLEYADMQTFLSGVARALKPGARFVLESGMAAESLFPKFEEVTSHQVQNIHVTIKEKYLAEQGCVDSEYVFERNGQSETRRAKHWIYTAAEIRRMLERAGLAVLNVYGSLKCEPFALGSGELLVVAERS